MTEEERLNYIESVSDTFPDMTIDDTPLYVLKKDNGDCLYGMTKDCLF